MKVQVDECMSVYYARELLFLVATLHSCGIIHADIKPDNIMLRDLRLASVSARPCFVCPELVVQRSICYLLRNFGIRSRVSDIAVTNFTT